MIAEGKESRLVAKHELARGHLNQRMGVRPKDQGIESPSGYVRGVFHHVRNALQRRKKATYD